MEMLIPIFKDKIVFYLEKWKGEYFDLEKPSDLQIFIHDIELTLRRFSQAVIIDEAQTTPQLFPVLRSMIDEKRFKNGRYYLLGSVNPALVKHISESLAGRVGIIELTPFLFLETMEFSTDFHTYWVRGGYPDAIMETKESKWQRWQENYIRTFIERDVARFALKTNSVQMRRLITMIANQHGGLLNISEFGRSLGISNNTAASYIDILEGHYLIRRLQPYYANIGKRLVKSPKMYIRDTGVLHYLLGISSERNLLESSKRGNSFEGLMIEQIIAIEQLQRTGTGFYFYRTHAGAEIDLIVDRGLERIGYEFKCAVSAGRKDWANLKAGIEDGIIDKGLIVYQGERNYMPTEHINVVSAVDYCSEWGNM
jgi:uncharacterized protein